MNFVRIYVAIAQILVYRVSSFSLKPAAEPLMNSGKALARAGELLIDLTTDLDVYGGGLSAAGAQIRNAGDCIAQAAASCRFKTGSELVTDELREAATCLDDASKKLNAAMEEAKLDDLEELAGVIELAVGPTQLSSAAIEAAGACIMQNGPPQTVGIKLVEGGQHLQVLSATVAELDPSKDNASLSSQRMNYAADQMIRAGKELRGIKKEAPKGKSWLKG